MNALDTATPSWVMVSAIDALNGGPRPATAFLNYRGDRTEAIRESITAGAAMGPTTFGEYLYPVQALYDTDDDSTLVGLSYLAPTDSLINAAPEARVIRSTGAEISR